MTHALVTIIAPLALDLVPAADARIDALGNPARDDIKGALDRLDSNDGTHFCSLHAVRSKDLGKAYLAFELSADGTKDEAIGRIARAIGPDLAMVFSLATDWKTDTEVGKYLTAHGISIGVGRFDNPGLAFAGTPGMSVGRIRAEQKLALRATKILTPQGENMWALERVNAVRDALRNDPELSDMLETGTSAPPYAPLDTAGLIGQLVLSFFATYLWPVGIVLLLLGLIGGVWNGWIAWNSVGFGAAFAAFVWGGLKWLIFWGLAALIALVLALIAGYGELRSLEEHHTGTPISGPATP